MAYRSSFGEVDKVLDIQQLITYLTGQIMGAGIPIAYGFKLSLNTLIPDMLEPIFQGIIASYVTNQVKGFLDITDKVTSHSIAYSISLTAYMEIWDVVQEIYPTESSQAANLGLDLDHLSDPAYLLCLSVMPSGPLSQVLIGNGPNDMGVVPTFLANQMENFAEEMGFEIPDTTPAFEFPEDETEEARTHQVDPWGRHVSGVESHTELDAQRQAMLDNITVSTWKPPTSGTSMILLGAAGVAAFVLLRK